MRALMTVSSKHGATKAIGDAIADTLRSAGIEVDTFAPERVASLAGYDAVIVGSALHMGRWMGPARDLVNEHADELRRLPVWLFASGPVTPLDDEGDAAEGKKLQALIGARDARVFAGQLKKDGLGFVERQIVRMIHSPWGDYRPWDDIRAWAQSIATSIGGVAV